MSTGATKLQNCDVANDNSCTTIDTYISMLGGVTMTLTPAHPTPSLQTRYSLTNFHGDTELILDNQAHPISDVMSYGPFGEILPQSNQYTSQPSTGTVLNATDTEMGWAADPARKRHTKRV